MAEHQKYRTIIRDIALDNYGYVTTKGASEAGVPAVELPKLAARGGLRNISYGLYRVSDIPPSRVDQYAEALLRVGAGAYLRGESVLSLLELGDINPRRIRVGTPRRTRVSLPPFVEKTTAAPGGAVVFYAGLASQPVAHALLECRGRVEPDQLLQAGRQARHEGYVTAAEWRRLNRELSA